LPGFQHLAVIPYFCDKNGKSSLYFRIFSKFCLTEDGKMAKMKA